MTAATRGLGTFDHTDTEAAKRARARRRYSAVAAATTLWLLAAAGLLTFGGGVAGGAGTAADAQYKPPPPPTTILSGLSQPAELAADSRGNLWFSQGGAPASTVVTLYVLPKGASIPAPVYTASGGNGSTTPFMIDIAFDAADNPHFVQWTGAGSTHQSSLVRVDATTGTPTVLASASGTHDNTLRITSGSGLAGAEVGVDGTVYWTTQSLGSSGNQESRLYALAPGAAAPALVAEFATTGLEHLIADFDIATDGTIYLSEAAGVPTGGAGSGSIGIYRIPPGGSPEPIRVFSTQVPTDPRPIYVGLDRQENLIVGERIINGFVSPNCAESTTFRLIRYDAASLSGPAPAGTVYSAATYPQFNFVFVGSSAYFRVRGEGAALFGLYSGNSRCGNPGAAITFTHLRMIAAEGSDAGGTQHLLFDDAPSPPATGFYSFAFSGNDGYATSSRLGTLSRIDLNKNAKKPK